MKKGIKKKVRTWGPSSIQTKERGNSAERFTTDLYLFMFLILTDQHVYKKFKGGKFSCDRKITSPSCY